MSIINEIYEFIKNTFTLEIYEDYINLSPHTNAFIAFNGKYNVFLSHNKICLDELNAEELQFIYLLYIQIKNNKTGTLGEDNLKKAFTFYFDINGKIIIFNRVKCCF